MSQIVEKEVLIRNKYGIHARPAAMLVQLANKYKSEIFVIKDTMEVNGKSIIGVMTLAANCGSKLKIRASGDDAQEAVDTITKLFDEKFGEQ